ncbi:hypothetical protein RDV64_17340 [Acuticoccus sp. MNP-M23]|uniref:hypothetical protein n=1 Tax=Acuticoccus sp. MNP-M23 TaxID=3072793 RepID=UPI0028164EB5|nr:hypothetical protein [Acuticoccus sp. MNP-M23]WMS41816.1 hypothetical protein RDV64_17340 [Acuticoccus sp. MNP-M23]
MNRARRKRLERLAHAQRALADAAVEQERNAIVRHRESEQAAGKILAALNGDNPLHGHLVVTMATTLDANARETSRLAAAVRSAEEARLAADTRARSLEGRHERARKEFRRAHEKRVLEAMTVPMIDPTGPAEPATQAPDQPKAVI